MKMLSKNQVIFMHRRIIENTCGTFELRDENLLESALNAPFQTFGGVELYPSLLEKAARLGCGIIKNHPFADGNKRIGAHVMLMFLIINGININYSDSDLIEIILKTASGRADEKQLFEWLNQRK